MQPEFRAVLYRGAYYATWKGVSGKWQRKALRTKDHREAEQALKGFAAQYEIDNRPDQITVEYCWNGYRETLGSRPTAATMLAEAKAILPFFGAMPADAITEDDCMAYRAAREALGRRPATILTEMSHLASALKWAAKKDLIAKAPAIWKPSNSPPRDLRLTREQGRAFLAACEMPHIRLFAILAMTTGARMGALLGLTWDRVDFDRGRIHLKDPALARTTKGRGLVPMNRTARAALSAAKAGALTPYVIEWNGKPVASVKTGIAAAARRAKLTWVTAHVFRHSAASWLAQDGVDLGKIAEFLGHADRKMAEKVYAKFTPDYLGDAADALEIGGIHGVLSGSFGGSQRTDQARKEHKQPTKTKRIP